MVLLFRYCKSYFFILFRKRKTEASGDEPDGKKAKVESEADLKEQKELKKQMTKIYYYRDMLQRHLAKKNLEELLTHNEQEIPSGEDRVRSVRANNIYCLVSTKHFCQVCGSHLCSSTEAN